MPSLNKLTIIGHLGRDPERGQSENAPVKFTVATTHRSRGEEQTEWWQVSAWDKTGKFCMDYLKKGALVYVEG